MGSSITAMLLNQFKWGADRGGPCNRRAYNSPRPALPVPRLGAPLQRLVDFLYGSHRRRMLARFQPREGFLPNPGYLGQLRLAEAQRIPPFPDDVACDRHLDIFQPAGRLPLASAGAKAARAIPCPPSIPAAATPSLQSPRTVCRESSSLPGSSPILLLPVEPGPMADLFDHDVLAFDAELEPVIAGRSLYRPARLPRSGLAPLVSGHFPSRWINCHTLARMTFGSLFTCRCTSGLTRTFAMPRILTSYDKLVKCPRADGKGGECDYLRARVRGKGGRKGEIQQIG